MTKVSPRKAAKTGCKRVSAGRRQSAAAAPGASLTLPDDVVITALALDLGKMIDAARQQVALAANAALTTLCWQLGRRVRAEVLQGRRAAYGVKIVAALGRQLEVRYGRGFSEKSLRHNGALRGSIPDAEIVSALWRQLSWSHFKQLIYVDEPPSAIFTQ